MDISEVRRRFTALIERPHGEFRLAEGAAHRPGRIPEVSTFKRICVALTPWLRSSPPAWVWKSTRSVSWPHLNAYLFDEQGFHGNQENYYDTRNSFLNEVIERKTGIPITLSVVYIELARQVGLPIVGVSMPGHFLVRYSAQPMVFWI